MGNNELWRVRNAAEKREKILDAIAEFYATHDYAPTRAQIAELTGISKNTVLAHVTALLKEGVLEEPGGPASRTLRIAGF